MYLNLFLNFSYKNIALIVIINVFSLNLSGQTGVSLGTSDILVEGKLVEKWILKNQNDPATYDVIIVKSLNGCCGDTRSFNPYQKTVQPNSHLILGDVREKCQEHQYCIGKPKPEYLVNFYKIESISKR